MTSEMQSVELQLTLTDISKHYGATAALSGFDLEIKGGECLAIVGENGAGKSTLLKIISGQIRPDQGRLQFCGEPFRPNGPREALRQGVVIVHQELCLASHLSVEANIMLGREPNRLGWRSARKCRALARNFLAQLDRSDLPLNTLVGELSPGMKQIVEIARALASDARVLLLDEPTSSLSEADTERLFQAIERLKKRGLAIVFISHALEEVDRVADRIAVLRDGQLVRVAKKTEWDRNSLISAMVGRSVEDLYPDRNRKLESKPENPPELARIVFESDSVSGRMLPLDVSFRVSGGRIFGIAGLIGSGRTELARVIMGLDPQKSGQLKLSGNLISDRARTRDRMKSGLGLLSEDRAGEGLALNRTVEENMLYPTYARSSRFGLIFQSKSRQRAEGWVKRLGIKCQSSQQSVRRLSGGNQQKVALARLFDQQGDVLILDEPTRGVDVGAKVEIYRMIRQKADEGRAVIVISSYLPELLGLCDDLAVMHNGKLSETKPVEEWSQEQIMRIATMAGSATVEEGQP
ncbi:MAG: sugar ABC transporter ATP-binding protein [Planctomycetota bacterium]